MPKLRKTQQAEQEDKPVEPTRCPVCGSVEFFYCCEWFTHSLDDCDLMNCAILREYQCQRDSCGISFWL